MQKNRIKHTYPLQHYNLNAAREIVPYLINKFHPQSVVDVGCGPGTFLKVFLDNGIEDILGIDGNWIDKSNLFIPEVYIKEEDLEKKIIINKKFDLVMCLEVAEHLSEKSEDILIDNLTSLGDKIIFSAAVIHQGGQNHLNEQSPVYWAEKFEKKGFVFYDVFRKHFWYNANVNWWYKQNMFLALNKTIDISQYSFTINNFQQIQEYVHPELLALYANELLDVKMRLNKIKQGKASGKLYLQMLKKKISIKFFKRQK
ncbi:MAG TPA: methyltransferase domain-containing protein [Chitinophagaceae bacterium]|nr:methyltransferase domain-containing protein [Chitinophagaceae bacterium]